MRMIEDKQKKAIWAASREFGLDRETVYDIILAVSEKEHMTELTYLEAAKVIGRIRGKSLKHEERKRTDIGGDPRTIPLRKKIYALTEELGWNNEPERLQGFLRRMYKMERVEWLSVGQCHQLIESLKKMIERESKKDG